MLQTLYIDWSKTPKLAQVTVLVLSPTVQENSILSALWPIHGDGMARKEPAFNYGPIKPEFPEAQEGWRESHQPLVLKYSSVSVPIHALHPTMLSILSLQAAPPRTQGKRVAHQSVCQWPQCLSQGKWLVLIAINISLSQAGEIEVSGNIVTEAATL